MNIFLFSGKNFSVSIFTVIDIIQNNQAAGKDKAMEITEIKIRKLITDGKLRGIISVTVDGVLAIHDIKVVQGEERLFVAMPSRRDDSGMFRDIVHPITSETRENIERQILSAYRMELDRQSAENISEGQQTIQ